MDRPHKIYSDCVESLYPADVHNLLKDERRVSRFRTHAAEMDMTTAIKQTILDSPKILPFAAEKYNISSNLKDYILHQVVVLPSDLPNKNGVGFPHKELCGFVPDVGRLCYDTFTMMPCHVEHDNKDYTKAQGIVLSSHYKPLRGYEGNLWKVVCLAAFDRNRNPILCNEMLNQENNSFSLGALTSSYTCSISGADFNNGNAENYTKLNRPSFARVNGKLAFLSAVDPKFFELSYVKNPAYVSATSPHRIIMFDK